MAVSLYEKLAPTFTAFEKVGKIANSYKIPESVSNSLEKYNEYIKVNGTIEKLTQINAASSAVQTYLDWNSTPKIWDTNKFRSPITEAYDKYRNYFSYQDEPISDYNRNFIDCFKTLKITNDDFLKPNLNEPFIDLKISNIQTSIKSLDDTTAATFTEWKKIDYRDLIDRLGIIVSDNILNHVNILFNSATPPTEDEIAEWKRRKKQILISLLSKLIKIKKEISKTVKLYKINRREYFRKIYCFLFKNLDDTDSVALISFAY